MKASIFFIAITVGVAGNLPEWPQFGGPNRNFMVDSKGLAVTWPAEGPKRLWMRPLGEGYSGISVDQGTLYTMYRKGEQEVAIAGCGDGQDSLGVCVQREFHQQPGNGERRGSAHDTVDHGQSRLYGRHPGASELLR
jgi:hypothetical protein